MVNDVYILDNFPNFATAVKEAKAAASALDCVAISTLNGDFLSPCIFTALDEGKTMLEGLNKAHVRFEPGVVWVERAVLAIVFAPTTNRWTRVDYVCLGNHELDLPFETLAARLKDFKVPLARVTAAAHPPFRRTRRSRGAACSHEFCAKRCATTSHTETRRVSIKASE
eukprot:6201782-Pleurochrysis_carterae.AAC.2